jgi:NUMOD1 domain
LIWVGPYHDKNKGDSPLFCGRNLFLSGDFNIYVGCSYVDYYARIIRYYHKLNKKKRPVNLFLEACGGVGNTSLVFFSICEKGVPITPEMVAELEYYFMEKLRPSLNIHLTSLVPSKFNKGTRIFVYDQFKTKLLYGFKSISCLVRAANTKHDTIQRHIKSKTLLLGTFYVCLEPLPQVSTKLHCTELEFIEFAKKTRTDFIAEPGGLYGKDKCKKVYVYDKDKTKLLREFPSKEYLEKTAKISHIFVNKFAKSVATFLLFRCNLWKIFI